MKSNFQTIWRRLPILAFLTAGMLLILLIVCSVAGRDFLKRQEWIMETPVPTRSPTYEPYTGTVYVMSISSPGAWLFEQPVMFNGKRIGSVGNGTAVEIFESRWVVEEPDGYCYCYLIRGPEGWTAWIWGEYLTPDPSNPPGERCFH